MDQAFIEQVTKLVIAKLEQVLDSELRTNFSASLPVAQLTQHEISRWNDISRKVYVFAQDDGCCADQAAAHPLTQDELRRWDEISASIHQNQPKSSVERGFVKVYQYG